MSEDDLKDGDDDDFSIMILLMRGYCEIDVSDGRRQRDDEFL